MHNLDFERYDCSEALAKVKNGTHNRKRTYLTDNEDSLIESHEEYNRLAEAGELKYLTSKLARPGNKDIYKDHDYWVAYDLFGSSLSYVSNHWNILKRLNGNRTLICPICGLSQCREMDHFAPRSKFPEHSCNQSNLIPLCHNCNNDKGDNWLNENSEQIFFNAFFDRELPESIVTCGFDVSRDLIRVSLAFSDSLDDENPQHKRIKQTVSRLNLMNRFEEEANRVLNREIRNLRSRYRKEIRRYADLDDFYTSSIEVMKDMLSEDGGCDFIEKEVISSLVESDVFKNYITTQLVSIHA